MSDATRRTIRTLLQFTAAGGLTALVNEMADGLSANWKVLVQGFNLILITLSQNFLEDAGAIPSVLKSPASSGAHPIPDDRDE